MKINRRAAVFVPAILAVNGVRIEADKEPWAAFQGLAGKIVSLTVNDKPSFDGARQVLIETMGSETALRQAEWVEKNRLRVAQATQGKVPEGRIYGNDGAWFAEGHGVDPDIEVIDDLARLAKGVDPQLERAIEEIGKLLKLKPAAAVPKPAYENRTSKAVKK